MFHAEAEEKALPFNPDVVFFTGSGAWQPIELIQRRSSLTTAVLMPDAKSLLAIADKGQAHLAGLCEEWAGQLKDRAWSGERAIPAGWKTRKGAAA